MPSLEHRANIKLRVLLEKSPSETLEMLKKANGNDGMKKTAVYEWHKGKAGRTVIKELYLEILKRLRVAIRRKRPEKWTTNDWFLLHDNAPPHRALIVKKYLARTQGYHSGTTSLFSRPSTNGGLPVSTAQNEIEGTPFCGFR
ncbi:hypothetical protein AVEN_130757-1 [Araneus ventricosus]|uniref:Mos1 transposase HTH domain-containing protein n=1 Tax=Araneus ventricosus TaxID=182803 RepID=A0A4Y2GIC1_ARAVE|nr:hypothetical protein AVEN_130757-1 [Araneus ventricosus]